MNNVHETIKIKPPELSVYGTVKVGDRGQVVIPSDARKELDIKPGDFLLVVSKPTRDGVVLIKTEVVEEMISKLSVGLTMSDDERIRPPAKKRKE